MKHEFFDIFFSARKVSKLFKSLDSMNPTDLDKIHVVVLNLSPRLSPISAKLFNCCLKEKCFPSPWQVSAACPVHNNAGDLSSPLQYRPISFLRVISQLFDAIINKNVCITSAETIFLATNSMAFVPPSPTDVLINIPHRICETLENKHLRSLSYRLNCK